MTSGVRSMTAFGIGRGEDGGRRIEVEVKSVNAKGIDLALRLPPPWSAFEPRVRRNLRARIARGKVHVHLRESAREGAGAEPLRVAEGRLAGLLDRVAGLRADHPQIAAPDAVACLSFPGVLVENEGFDPEGDLPPAFDRAMTAAVEAHQADAAREGAAMAEAMTEFLGVMDDALARIRIRAPEIVREIRTGLASRIAEILVSAEMDGRRIEEETAILADKADIREEIDRLTAHLARARNLLGQGGPIGIELGFVAQEMLREANTIGSKAQVLAAEVILIKTAIERFREQGANVV